MSLFSACKWVKVSSGLSQSEASPVSIVEGLPMAAATRSGSEYGHLAQGDKFVIRCRKKHVELFSWSMPPEVAQETEHSVVGSGEVRLYLTAKEEISEGQIEHVVYGFDHRGDEAWWTYDKSIAINTPYGTADQMFFEDTQVIDITADHKDRPWVLVCHGDSFDWNRGFWLYTGTHHSGELWPVKKLSGFMSL